MLMRLRRPTVQPQQLASLNWQHPLADKLCFAANLAAAPYDYVTGAYGTASGTAPPTQGPTATSRAQQWGGYNFTGTAFGASYLDFGTRSDTANLATQACTWAFFVYLKDTAAHTFQLAQRNDGNTVSAGWGIESIGSSPGPTAALLFERSTTNTKVQAHSAVDQPQGWDQWLTIVVTSPGDGVGANVRFYYNGLLSVGPSNGGTDVLVVGTGAQGNDSANALQLGRSVYQSGSLSGCMAVALIAKRVWSLADAQLFHTNPFALWASRRWAPKGFPAAAVFPAWRWFLSPEVLPW